MVLGAGIKLLVHSLDIYKLCLRSCPGIQESQIEMMSQIDKVPSLAGKINNYNKEV